MSAVKLRAQESSLYTSNPAGYLFKHNFVDEDSNIPEEDMSKMVETWINIEDNIEIMNDFLDT